MGVPLKRVGLVLAVGGVLAGTVLYMVHRLSEQDAMIVGLAASVRRSPASSNPNLPLQPRVIVYEREAPRGAQNAAETSDGGGPRTVERHDDEATSESRSDAQRLAEYEGWYNGAKSTFESQPIDSAWAAATETQLEGFIAHHLESVDQPVPVAMCRQKTCAVELGDSTSDKKLMVSKLKLVAYEMRRAGHDVGTAVSHVPASFGGDDRVTVYFQF